MNNVNKEVDYLSEIYDMLVEVDLKEVENKLLKARQVHAVLLDNFDLKMHIELLRLEGKAIKL